MALRQLEEAAPGSSQDHVVQRPSCFAAGRPLDKSDLMRCFLDDVHSGRLVTGPPPGRPEGLNKLRVVQWNINSMQGGRSPALISQLLLGLDADVLVLQEFCIVQPEAGYSHESEDLKRRLHEGGFQIFVATRISFPTALATRLPTVAGGETVMLDDLRAAMFVNLQHGSGTVRIYGTHFSDSNASGTRLSEADALLEHHATHVESHQRRTAHKSCFPCFSSKATSPVTAVAPTLVVGDFNQQRQSDYPPGEWAMIARSMQVRGAPEDDGVCRRFEAAGFSCFLDAEGADQNWPVGSPPPPTHWTGTVIDYTFSVGIKVQGIYVVQTNLSDHLPVVSDWTL